MDFARFLLARLVYGAMTTAANIASLIPLLMYVVVPGSSYYDLLVPFGPSPHVLNPFRRLFHRFVSR